MHEDIAIGQCPAFSGKCKDRNYKYEGNIIKQKKSMHTYEEKRDGKGGRGGGLTIKQGKITLTQKLLIFIVSSKEPPYVSFG